jgi:hypothetical protein
MRWKVIILVAAAAALFSCVLWGGLAIGVFGSAGALAQHQVLFAASLLIPLGLTAFASTFVYRHTARKRRTQALITAVLSLLLTPAIYLAASFLAPQRLHLPRIAEDRAIH